MLWGKLTRRRREKKKGERETSSDKKEEGIKVSGEEGKRRREVTFSFL